MNSPFGRYLLRLLLLPLFLAFTLPAWAQQTTHSISGRVYDEAGEALPSANVSLLLPDGKLRTGLLRLRMARSSFVASPQARTHYASPSWGIRP